MDDFGQPDVVPAPPVDIEPPAPDFVPQPYQDGEYWVTPLGSGREVRELMPAAPVAPAPAPATRLTRLAFRNRFTAAEKIALYAAAKTSVEVQIYLDDVNAATYIDLHRPDTRASVQSLETAGLLTAGRALQILDAPIQPDEVPT